MNNEPLLIESNAPPSGVDVLLMRNDKQHRQGERWQYPHDDTWPMRFWLVRYQTANALDSLTAVCEEGSQQWLLNLTNRLYLEGDQQRLHL